MNDIHKYLTHYHNAKLISHHPTILTKRLISVFKYMNISEKGSQQINDIKNSIKYPLVNGVFVVLLDLASFHEFVHYLQTSHILPKFRSKINSFFKRVKQTNGYAISISDYKFPSFAHKQVSYTSNTKPKLTNI